LIELSTYYFPRSILRQFFLRFTTTTTTPLSNRSQIRIRKTDFGETLICAGISISRTRLMAELAS